MKLVFSHGLFNKSPLENFFRYFSFSVKITEKKIQRNFEKNGKTNEKDRKAGFPKQPNMEIII